MSLTGKITNLFADKEKTSPIFPRTKVKAISDDNGIGLNVLLGEKASIQKYPATISTTWTGSAAPYAQEITITGITADDTPIVDVILSGTYTIDETRLTDWGKIYRIVTAENKITVYAKEATTVELPIQLQVVG